MIFKEKPLLLLLWGKWMSERIEGGGGTTTTKTHTNTGTNTSSKINELFLFAPSSLPRFTISESYKINLCLCWNERAHWCFRMFLAWNQITWRINKSHSNLVNCQQAQKCWRNFQICGIQKSIKLNVFLCALKSIESIYGKLLRLTIIPFEFQKKKHVWK